MTESKEHRGGISGAVSGGAFRVSPTAWAGGHIYLRVQPELPLPLSALCGLME